MTENEISYKVIGAAIEVHKSIGPGLLESAYESALAYDLTKLGLLINFNSKVLKNSIHRVVNNL